VLPRGVPHLNRRGKAVLVKSPRSAPALLFASLAAQGRVQAASARRATAALGLIGAPAAP